jgi:hypothetical protein
MTSVCPAATFLTGYAVPLSEAILEEKPSSLLYSTRPVSTAFGQKLNPRSTTQCFDAKYAGVEVRITGKWSSSSSQPFCGLEGYGCASGDPPLMAAVLEWHWIKDGKSYIASEIARSSELHIVSMFFFPLSLRNCSCN